MKIKSFYRVEVSDWLLTDDTNAGIAASVAIEHPEFDEAILVEYIRQWVLSELITSYAYPFDWIGKQIQFTTSPLDQHSVKTTGIQIEPENGSPILFIEVLCRGTSDSEFAQAESHLHSLLGENPTATVGFLTDSTLERTRVIVNKTDPLEFTSGLDIPPYVANKIDFQLNLTENDSVPIENGLPSGLKPLQPQDLNVLFKCHSIIRDFDGLHADACLDELCKLIHTKIWDECNVIENNADSRFAFQSSGGNVEEIAANIRGLYLDAVNINVHWRSQTPLARPNGIFDEALNLSSAAIAGVVDALKDYSLVDSPADIKGMAFQKVLGPAIRSGMGQYFTPEPVINMVVDMLQPASKDVILDPFCGSAHFLSQCLSYVSNHSEEISDGNRLREFAINGLHGIEKSDRMVRIGLADMLLKDGGQINIHYADSLLNFTNLTDILNVISNEKPIQESFDIVVTNPPFGSVLPTESLQSKFYLADGKESLPLEVLGLERSLQFLKPGGRLAIVLPESILNTKQMSFVRNFILSETRVLAIVSLPPQTFMPFDGVGKASVLVLEKLNKNETPINRELTYDVFVGMAHHVGYDSTNRMDPLNDLPEIAAAYTQYKFSDFLNGNKDSFVVSSCELNRTFSAHGLRPSISTTSWPTKRLGELVSDVFSGTTPAKAKYTDAGHRILKVRDITNEGINWAPLARAFVDSKFFSSRAQRRLEIGDILLTSAAHQPSYIGKKVDIVECIPEEYSDALSEITSHQESDPNSL